MNLFLIVAMAAALIGTASAAAILAQDWRQPVNRYAGLLIAGVAWWGTCDVWRLLAQDPESALLASKASSPGWVMIGPLALSLVLSMQRRPSRRVTRLVPWAFGLSGLFVVATFVTPWMFGEPQRAPSGWVVPPGPLVVILLVVSLIEVVPAAIFGLSRIRTSPSASDRAQVRWIAIGVLLPLLLIPATNVLLPLLGRPTVRLGSLAFALFGAMIAWVSLRHGTSPIARGGFARQMVNAHPDGVAVVAFSGEILSASDGLGRLLDEPAHALEGRTLADLLELPEGDALSELRHTEAALHAGDGREIPVAVTSQILPDRRGLDFALLVVIRDLREVAALRSQLVTSGRLAAIGQLAAGIAHEINNPMAFVRTNLTLLGEHWESLQKAPPSDEERRRVFAEGEELLDESLEGVARACAIVRDINNFSHAGSGRREHVDIHALLDNVLRVAMPHLGEPVRVERDFKPVPTVWGASQELKQVFLNLLLNAAQALDSHGVLRVSTRPDGDQVLVQICDNGCGIPEEALDKVFDPFFTTKPVGEGTGMGLFISYQIVRNHGGELTVDSTPEEGTTVSVRLPTHPA